MSSASNKASVGCAAVFLLLLVIVYPVAYRGSESVTTITVNKLEQIKKQDSGKYLVFADGETFEITDSILFGRFDSSDLYGRITAGRKYRVKVAGWRVQVLSMYRNILTADEVHTP